MPNYDSFASTYDPASEHVDELPVCQVLEQSCSACGSPMYEVDRRQENGTLYRWLECVDPACGSQWLEHLPCW